MTPGFSSERAAVLAVAILTMMLVSSSLAGTVELEVFEKPDDDHDGELAQLDLTIEYEDLGTYLDLTFRNESSVTSTVTEIYFEQDLLDILGDAVIQDHSAGVEFVPAKKLQDPPGGTNIGWDETIFEVDREKGGGVSNGIDNPDEWLKLRFGYRPGKGLDDFLAVVLDGGRIAEKVQRVGSGGISVSAVTTVVVPLPPAAASGLALLIGAGWLRRRRGRRAA